MPSKLETYKQTYTEESAPGLDAIQAKEKEIYGNQEATHIATAIPYGLGGEDPLWAVDYFVSEKHEKHFHHISLGFTNLFYDEQFAKDDINGFGFELTFRHLPLAGDRETIMWPAGILQNIARYVFDTQNVFDDYHYISANGPLKLGIESDVTAIVFYTDPEMGVIDSPHGHLKFLQIYGITTQEYEDLQTEKYQVEELVAKHKQYNPLLITDLKRK